MHLLLWLIFCQSHTNFINVHTVYASEIRVQLKKTGTERSQEHI